MVIKHTYFIFTIIMLDNNDDCLNESITCSICFNTYNNNCIIIVQCKHMFCSKCINQWLNIKNSCPKCRADNIIVKDYISYKNNNKKKLFTGINSRYFNKILPV